MTARLRCRSLVVRDSAFGSSTLRARCEEVLLEVLSPLVTTPSVNPAVFELAMAERVCA